MSTIIIQAVAAFWLLLIAATVTTRGFPYALFFKVIPLCIGIALGCNTYLAWVSQ